jgi:hypothetical protein
MIYFNFRLENPWSKQREQMDYFCKDWKLSKTKHLEVQVSRNGVDPIFNFIFDLCWRGRDHAGPSVEIGLFGFWSVVKIYDSRHWNYTENRWEIYPGEDD